MLTNRQLSLMQAISKEGIPEELMEIFLRRCGTSEEEWQGLQGLDYVYLDDTNDNDCRWKLTKLGFKVFKKEKVGRYY